MINAVLFVVTLIIVQFRAADAIMLSLLLYALSALLLLSIVKRIKRDA